MNVKYVSSTLYHKKHRWYLGVGQLVMLVTSLSSFGVLYVEYLFALVFMAVAEFAYSSRATTKCDVYSYGVILMELLTGKKPVEAEFGENRNIVFWVSNKVEGKEGARPSEVLDPKLSCSFKEDMVKVLRIAIRCTYKAPTSRPTMKEVVQLLIEAEPRGSDSCKLSTNDVSNVTVIKKPYEL